jgi:hypothetical protein
MTEQSNAQKAVDAASDVIGAAVGGSLGFVAGGPLAAGAAGVAGVVATRVIRDFAARVLSGRESARVDDAAQAAIEEITSRLADGQSPRDDGFFDAQQSRPSTADEIFEGCLLAAKNTHQQKKAAYLGQLFANIAFDPSCKESEASQLIHTAEAITYSQYLLLRLIASEKVQTLRTEPFKTKVPFGTIALLHEIHDLANRNLVVMHLPSQSTYTILLGISEIVPAHLKLAVGGVRIHRFLGLEAIPDHELEETAVVLR